MPDHPKEWDELDIDRLLRQLREPEEDAPPEEEAWPEEMDESAEAPEAEEDAPDQEPEADAQEEEPPVQTPVPAPEEDPAGPDLLPLPELPIRPLEGEAEEPEEPRSRFGLFSFAHRILSRLHEGREAVADRRAEEEERELPGGEDRAWEEPAPAPERRPERPSVRPAPPVQKPASPAEPGGMRSSFESGRIVTLNLNRRPRAADDSPAFSPAEEGEEGPDLLTDLLPPMERPDTRRTMEAEPAEQMPDGAPPEDAPAPEYLEEEPPEPPEDAPAGEPSAPERREEEAGAEPQQEDGAPAPGDAPPEETPDAQGPDRPRAPELRRPAAPPVRLPRVDGAVEWERPEIPEGDAGAEEEQEELAALFSLRFSSRTTVAALSRPQAEEEEPSPAAPPEEEPASPERRKKARRGDRRRGRRTEKAAKPSPLPEEAAEEEQTSPAPEAGAAEQPPKEEPAPQAEREAPTVTPEGGEVLPEVPGQPLDWIDSVFAASEAEGDETEPRPEEAEEPSGETGGEETQDASVPEEEPAAPEEDGADRRGPEPDGEWVEPAEYVTAAPEKPRGPGLLSRLNERLRALAAQRRAAQEAAAERKAPEREEKVIRLPHREPGAFRRRLDQMGELADRFAEDMFQGDEPVDEEEERAQRLAERYIPGTDEERPVERRPRRKKREQSRRRPVRRAPDTSPKQLARTFYSSWKSTSRRLPVQFLLAVLLLAFSALVDGELPFLTLSASWLEDPHLTGAVLALALGLAAAVGLDTLLDGVVQLFRGRPGLNTVSSFGVCFTLIDAVWYALPGREGPLPFAGFAALSLWAVAWGNCRKKQGLYQSCQMAAAVSEPQRLTLDQEKWDGKGVFCKETGSTRGFGSQMQELDGAQRVYRYAAPVVMMAGLIFGVLAAVGQGGAQRLLWNWSVIFVLAAPLSATMAYGLPYARLVRRLNRSGVILAGWEGVDSMSGSAGIAIGDTDLFPDGFVQFKGIKNFGQVSLEKLTGCTASMVREAGTGLAKIFDDQVRIQGGFYRRVDELKYSEAGGFSGSIRGDQVLIGSAGYMKVMGVPLRQGEQVRNAVFCVINGQLQGIFSLNYSVPSYVRPALLALIHGGVNPILATRDFNITPQMLRQRFKLPADRMEYPPVERRHQLSAKGQAHNPVLAALIYREGLGPYTDAILGGRRLGSVVRLNTAVTVAASVIGALLGFFLTMSNAFTSLNLLNTLFFLLMWLVPPILISGSVNKF